MTRIFGRRGGWAALLHLVFPVALMPCAALAQTAPAPAPTSPAQTSPARTAPASLVARIPPRPAPALSGSQFVAYVAGKSGAERELAIRDEFLSGNIPSFLRHLKWVELSCCDGKQMSSRAGVWVMPDYLAIGSDQDFVRFPASFDTASVVARAFGFVLPTTAIVDAIYRQAKLRLAPLPMSPGREMTSTAYFAEHDRKIRAQMLRLSPQPLGELAAGHKKDYVLTNRLARSRSQEAIYGWHRGDGAPIQPLSLVHGARYADYSHGVRLVSETVFVDGVASSFYDLIEKEPQAELLSREGAIQSARHLMEPRLTAGSCSNGSRGGSSGGSAYPALGCRANTEPASGRHPRAPESGRKRTSSPSSP